MEPDRKQPENNLLNIISWNVNGIRANILTGPGEKYKQPVKAADSRFVINQESNFAKMISSYSPDIVCLQETRCAPIVFDDIDMGPVNLYPYRYLNPSTSDGRGRGSGYAGTAIFSKIEPLEITMDLPTLDEPNREGRCITAEFDKFFLINVYTPNSGTNEAFRLDEWDGAMLRWLAGLKKFGKTIVFVGDMNVCREEIDIFSGFPSGSKRIAGLLPEERINMQHYMDAGFIDTYRRYHENEDEGFTWWNQGIRQFRELNKGWRIDYGLVWDGGRGEACVASDIASEVMGSDHCPIVLKMKM